LLGCVLRDVEHHALTREVSDLRFGPFIAGWHVVLGEGLTGRSRRCCTWRSGFHRLAGAGGRGWPLPDRGGQGDDPGDRGGEGIGLRLAAVRNPYRPVASVMLV
jgi:hypothetical protein